MKKWKYDAKLCLQTDINLVKTIQQKLLNSQTLSFFLLLPLVGLLCHHESVNYAVTFTKVVHLIQFSLRLISQILQFCYFLISYSFSMDPVSLVFALT